MMTRIRAQVLAAITLAVLQHSALAFAPVGGYARGVPVVSVDFPPASFAGRSTTSALAAGGRPKFGEPGYDGDPTGLKRGAILLPIVLLVNVWMFSIPVEFRRARICSEQQVRENPSSKCMTTETWRQGVADYYANGGESSSTSRLTLMLQQVPQGCRQCFVISWDFGSLYLIT